MSRLVSLTNDIISRLNGSGLIVGKVSKSYVPVYNIEHLAYDTRSVIVTPMSEELERQDRCGTRANITMQVAVVYKMRELTESDVESMLNYSQLIFDYLLNDGSDIYGVSLGAAYSMSEPFSQNIAIDQNSFVNMSNQNYVTWYS